MKIQFKITAAARLLFLAGSFALISGHQPLRAQSIKAAPLHFYGPLSGINVPAKKVGVDWTAGSPVLVDQAGALIPNAKQTGVKSAASFTYMGKDNLARNITVRVFVFDSAASAQRWLKRKCNYKGWEKEYRLVPDLDFQAYELLPHRDFPNTSQRICAFENVGMTVYSTGKGILSDHNRVAKLYAAEIRRLEKPVKTPAQHRRLSS